MGEIRKFIINWGKSQGLKANIGDRLTAREIKEEAAFQVELMKRLKELDKNIKKNVVEKEKKHKQR